MLGLPGPCTHPCTAESLGTRTRPNNGTEGGGATPEAAAETDTARPGAGHLGSPRPQAGSSTAPPLCAYRSTRSDQSTGKPVAIDSCACVLETASLRAGRHGTVQSPQSSVERSACPLGVLECSRWTTRVRASPLGWRCPDANHHRGHISATSRLHLGHISATSRLHRLAAASGAGIDRCHRSSHRSYQRVVPREDASKPPHFAHRKVSHSRPPQTQMLSLVTYIPLRIPSVPPS